MKKGYVIVFDYETDYEYCRSKDWKKIEKHFRDVVKTTLDLLGMDKDWDGHTIDECVEKRYACFDNHYILIRECTIL